MVVGINHDVAGLCWIGEGGGSSVAERSITFYIVLIMSDVCGGERALCAFITGSEVYGERTGTGCLAGRQTPPLSFLSFLHGLRQRLRGSI